MRLPFYKPYVPLVMSCIAAFFSNVAGGQHESAKQVSATITGVMVSGFDASGVFGSPETNLAGRSVTVRFIFDSTKGIQGSQNCSNGLPCKSWDCSNAGCGNRTDKNTSSPGIAAIIQVGDGQFMLGGFPVASMYSQALRSVPPDNSNIFFQVGEFYTGVKYSDRSYDIGSSYVQASIFPPTDGPPLTTDYHWNDSLFTVSKLSNYRIGFGIIRLHSGNPKPLQQANGSFLPTSITVSGLDACSSISVLSDQEGLLRITDPIESVPSSMPGSAICPLDESTMINTCVPSGNWQQALQVDESTYHSGFHVYKEQKLAQQWGAECAYFSEPYYPLNGTLVPNNVPGHGTADYWPDGSCGHLLLDPGGPRSETLARINGCTVLGDDYSQYWSTHPHPPGIQ